MTARTEKKYYTAAEVVRSFCKARTCTIHIYTTPENEIPEFVITNTGTDTAGARTVGGVAGYDTCTLHGLVADAESALDRYARDQGDGDRSVRDRASLIPVVAVDHDSPPTARLSPEPIQAGPETVVAPIDDVDTGERLGHLFVTGAAGPAAAEPGTDHKLSSETATHLIRHIGLSISQDRALLRAHREGEHARVCLREATHRMKNALQTVESLLSLQAGTHDEGPLRGVLREAAQRVRTIQILYDRLTYDGGTDGVALSLHLYLTTLVESLQDVYRNVQPVTWNVNVEDITLSAEHLPSLGLIVNEVISNALIHAFPTGRHGGIEGSAPAPTIHATAGRHGSNLVLRVADNGVGVPRGFEPGESAGLGTTIVKLLTERLDGTLTYERSDGTTVSIAIPLEHVRA